MKYTWDNAADKTLQVYGKVLAESEATQTASASTQVFDLDSQVTHFQDVLERGEMAAKEKDLPAAEKHLDEAERLDPNSVRMIRARGAVALAKGDIVRARAYFERGLRLDSANARLYSGLGMCEMQSGEPAKAHALFVKALEIAPHELVAILQLLECSYTLNEYGDLERVLRRYLKDHAQDMQMQYCLAGCLFKQNKLAESERLTDAILKADASNLGAKQLKAAIEEAHAAANLNATPVVELKAENVAFNMPKINIKLPDMPAASAPAEQSADKREAQVIKPAFDATDREITEFEELKRAKKYDEVVKLATEKLNSPLLNPAQKERLTLLLAECEVLTGEIVKADARFNEILEGNSQSARAMCGKGAIAASRGQWDVANDFFTKANSIDVNYDVAWAGLGLYSYSKEDYEAAWSRFMRAIELNAENVRALLGIIELGYSLGRLSEVEHVLKLYLDMHPLDLNFLYSLAGCYFAQDKLSEAVAELDKIRMFEPENKNAQELREMIEQKLSAGSIGVNA